MLRIPGAVLRRAAGGDGPQAAELRRASPASIGSFDPSCNHLHPVLEPASPSATIGCSDAGTSTTASCNPVESSAGSSDLRCYYRLCWVLEPALCFATSTFFLDFASCDFLLEPDAPRPADVVFCWNQHYVLLELATFFATSTSFHLVVMGGVLLQPRLQKLQPASVFATMVTGWAAPASYFAGTTHFFCYDRQFFLLLPAT